MYLASSQDMQTTITARNFLSHQEVKINCAAYIALATTKLWPQFSDTLESLASETSLHVIHHCYYCSGGCGRTGTYIAISILLERLKTEGVVDVFQTARTLRLQRPSMIQSVVSVHIPVI